jgi:hypothetical protein
MKERQYRSRQGKSDSKEATTLKLSFYATVGIIILLIITVTFN